MCRFCYPDVEKRLASLKERYPELCDEQVLAHTRRMMGYVKSAGDKHTVVDELEYFLVEKDISEFMEVLMKDLLEETKAPHTNLKSFSSGTVH